MRRGNVENKDFKDYYDQIKEDLSGYISKRLELFKLSAYSKTSIAVSTIAYSLIVSLMVFAIFLIFLFILGFFFAELVGSLAGGFGILILLSILVLIIFIIAGRHVRNFIGNKIIKLIKQMEEDE